MKAKFLKLIIERKIDHWASSIKDESLRALVKENTIVTGGAITSMLLNEEVNDFDVYFRTRDCALRVAEYYVGKFNQNPPTYFTNKVQKVECQVESTCDRVKIVVKSAGVASEKGADSYQYFETTEDPDSAIQTFMEQATNNIEALDEFTPESVESEKDDKKRPTYRPMFLSSNAITLSDKIQIVVRFFGEPDEIHGNYDFVHCMNYWSSWDRKLVLKTDALEATLSKDLRYVGSKYPICSVIRARKFIKRGWSINAGQYLKMAFQIAGLNLNDVNVLEEQLVGVDAAYFRQLIDALREHDPIAVDQAYLTTLIDRIF